jgi:hypothetical protein
VSRAGRELTHRYQLRNRTTNDVAIVNVVNRKPCCGRVNQVKTVLRPGNEVAIEVILLVGDRFGDVVHETEVVTEPTDVDPLVLKTSARVVPEIQVEAEDSARIVLPVGSNEDRVVPHRVLAWGTETDPPIDLDRLTLRSTIKVEWFGPKEQGIDDDGLPRATRRFRAKLPAHPSAGPQSAELVLFEGDTRRHVQTLRWEVVSALVAAPEVLIFRSGASKSRVLIRSTDRRPFRVLGVSSGTDGLQGRAVASEAAATQIVEFDGEPRRIDGRPVATVLTDHPAQREVVLPLVFLE